MHCVLETHAFERQAKIVGLSEDDRLRIATILSEDPMAGDIIPGTGGARKLRYARTGAGKRSGYRVITYYAASDVPVYLLDILDKGQRLNLSEAEKNDLKKVLATVADNYRKSVVKKVSKLSEAS